MSQELIQISIRKAPIKILLVVLLLVAGVWSYFVVRWYLGNTMAEYFNADESSMDVARRAVSMAPSDPLTHWRIAQVSQKALPLDQHAAAIAEYEKAVSLSPYDYRFWMSLGRAHEQAGNAEKAELALKRAVSLAPSYAYPHWYLGNLLLRNGHYDEAFAEMRIASDADPDLRPQQLNLIWQIYSDDPEALKNAVGTSSIARAQFALYLLEQRRVDEGLRLWHGMSDDEKKANQNTGQLIIEKLIKEFRFHDAVKVWNEITSKGYQAELGQVFDGGFDAGVTYGSDTVFGWQVKGSPQMEIAIDPSKSHSGGRSLRMTFQVRANLETINITQIVPVQPQTEYEFECYVSTNSLQTGSAPNVQIDDTGDGVNLVSSQPAPSGTTNWNRITHTFKTGAKTEAVILKIVRVSCSTEETPVCPIFGSVWYDDFSFKRRR